MIPKPHLCLMVGLVLTAAPATAEVVGPSRSLFPATSDSIFPPPMDASTAGASRSIFPSAQNATSMMEKGLLKAGDFATSAPFTSAVGAITEGAIKDAADLRQALKEARTSGAEGLRSLERRLSGIDNPELRGLLDDTRTKIKAELDGLEKSAARAAAQGSFLARLGDALDILDFVSVAAQSAGYLAEGDTTGAVGVVLNDLAKKGAEGTGTFLTSWVPGGPVFGSWAGTNFYETHIQPELEAREQAVRDEKLRRAVANKPWLVPQEYMDSSATIRPLDADEYIERGTGLVKRRSPEDQASYERIKFVQWRNDTAMMQIEADHAAGKITDAQLRSLQVSFSQRSFATPWVPRGYETLMGDPTQDPAAQVPPADQEAEDQQTAAPDADPPAVALEPVALSASGSVTHSFPDWDGGEVVSTFELAFWNLGAQSPTHGQAVLKITTTFDGSTALVGTFSGGPNGTLTFPGEDGTLTFQVQNGIQVVGHVERFVDGVNMEQVTLTMPVSDPSAFDGWPKQ